MNSLNPHQTADSSEEEGYIVTRKGPEPEKVVKTRHWIRQQIETRADMGSREGILADTVALILVYFSQLTTALAEAKTVSDINTATQPIAEVMAVVDVAVKAGSLKLPYMVKPLGAEGILSDISTLSNEITDILLKAQTQSQ